MAKCILAKVDDTEESIVDLSCVPPCLHAGCEVQKTAEMSE